MRIGRECLHPPLLIDDGECMSSDTTPALPVWGGPWTGPDGVAHIRNAGTAATFCGIEVGAYTNTRPAGPCDACVAASLATYATSHACVPGCRR